MQKLGYKAYHMREAAINWKDGGLRLWDEAYDAKYNGKGEPFTKEDFDKFLGEYQYLSDIPMLLFVDDFLRLYPDVKVVLTSRDADSWVRSMEDVFYDLLTWRFPRWDRRRNPDGFFGNYLGWIEKAIHVWTDGDPQNREALRRGFHKHYEYVRRVVPKERLLEFDLKDGWAPLCAFLGKEVPNEPYPRLNEAKATAKLHKLAVVLGLIRIGKTFMRRVGIPVAVCGLAYWLFRYKNGVAIFNSSLNWALTFQQEWLRS